MDLFTPLSDEELDWLDEFLLDRFGEEDDSLDENEGILNVSELDGFLTAIVSGPVAIQPSRWLPAVWGNYEPEWKNQEDFEKVLSLLIRHMNSIVTMLMQQPEDFEPLFNERVVEGKTYTIVDDWCEGYVRGVKTASESWPSAEMELLLSPIMAFTSETDWRGHAFSTESEIENLHEAIRRNVRKIHAYWLARRGIDAPPQKPARRSEPAIGRNDPCPCGSGKKFKKCCLH